MTRFLQIGDLAVLRIGLGTNRIKNTHEAHQLLRFAFDSGINFYDTANIYQGGESELSIAEALSPYAKNLCITTKGGFKKYGSGEYKPEGHPAKLKQKLEESLTRLRLDQIYLYQLHRVDPDVPLEDSLGALRDFQLAGKVCHIGLSEVSISQIKKAQSIIDVVTVQNRYNLFERNHDAVVDFCQEQGIIFIPFFPLGSAAHSFPKNITQALDRFAEKYHCTSHQIALAWLLNRSPSMLPIPGTLSKQHVLENIAALSIQLSEDDFVALSNLDRHVGLG